MEFRVKGLGSLLAAALVSFAPASQAHADVWVYEVLHAPRGRPGLPGGCLRRRARADRPPPRRTARGRRGRAGRGRR